MDFTVCLKHFCKRCIAVFKDAQGIVLYRYTEYTLIQLMLCIVDLYYDSSYTLYYTNYKLNNMEFIKSDRGKRPDDVQQPLT